MNCAIHAEREATAYCRTCGKPMCAECTRSVRGVLYCEDCLATQVSATPAPSISTPSPLLATVLGFIPGLGAIFNGEYVKGVIHIAIFAGIIAMLHNPLSVGMQTFFFISLVCFYFYMPIEAYQTAHARHLAAQGLLPPAMPTAATASAAGPIAAPLAPEETAAAGADASSQRRAYFSPVTAAVILIALGILLLLANLGMLAGEWFGHLWPAILVGVGVWLLWKRFREPAAKGGA